MSAEGSHRRSLYPAFLISLLIIALPIKNLAYLAPPLYVGIRWLQQDGRLLRRGVVLTSLLVVVSAIALLADHLAGFEISLPAMGIAILTYGSLLVVLCHGFSDDVDEETFRQYVSTCSWFIIVQSLIGFVQFAATRNPDAVCGTFGLLDGFVGSITIAQVYLTFTLFSMMLFVLISPQGVLSVVALLLGLTVCILAHSGHQTLFLLLTFAACSLLRFADIKGLVVTSVVGTAVVGLMLFVYPNTVALSQDWYHKTVVETKRSPKARAVSGAAEILSTPKNLLFGTGLGQFTSRAALVASNGYVNADLPRAITGKSRYFETYTEPLIRDFEEIGEGSAVAKPYMSAISLPVELGAPLFAALLVVIGAAAYRNMKLIWRPNATVARVGMMSLAGIIFFCLCCLVENYAEFSQAVFLPFLLYIVAGCRAKTLLEHSVSNGRPSLG